MRACSACCSNAWYGSTDQHLLQCDLCGPQSTDKGNVNHRYLSAIANHRPMADSFFLLFSTKADIWPIFWCIPTSFSNNPPHSPASGPTLDGIVFCSSHLGVPWVPCSPLVCLGLIERVIPSLWIPFSRWLHERVSHLIRECPHLCFLWFSQTVASHQLGSWVELIEWELISWR